MASKRDSRFLASGELLIAAAFWGFGFVATVWALDVLSAYQLTFLRFFIAGFIGLGFVFHPKARQACRDNLKLSFLPAILLTGTLILQTVGLNYTTATKSGFITTLYVVFVPVIDWMLKGRKLPLTLWACVITALCGTGMIVNLGLASLNIGDLLTLACAILAAAQIVILGEISRKVERPFIFNIVQSVWAALLCLPIVLATAPHPSSFTPQTWPAQAIIGILVLAFGSTILAFYLQVRAQARLSATVSSLLFILESPFAMLFAAIFLGERLGLIESLGAFLIFLSAAAASLLEAKRKKF